MVERTQEEGDSNNDDNASVSLVFNDLEKCFLPSDGEMGGK